MLRTAWISLALLLPSQEPEAALRSRHEEITAYLKTAKSEREFRAAAGDLLKLADQAFQQNKYELAAKVYGDLEKVARGTLKDAGLALSAQENGKRAQDIGREFKKALKSFLSIEEQKGTPEDQSAVGRFLCFTKGDWDLGLPYLAKGKEAALQTLAEQDLAGQNPAALAEAWHGLLKKEAGVKDRVLHWSAKAWPMLEGIAREKARERAKGLQRLGPAKRGALPSSWRGEGTQPEGQWLESEFARSGKYSIALRSGLQAPGKPSAMITQPMQVPPGETLKLSVWVLADGTDGGDLVRLFFSDAAGKPLGARGPFIPADFPFWRRLEQEFTLPPEAAQMSLGVLAVGKQAGLLWIDALSVKSADGKEYAVNGDFER